MATIGIDATALSTPASGGIGSAQYRTMRALAELDTPHRFVLYAARPPLVPFTGRPLDLPWPVRLGTGPLTRSNILWMQTGVNRLLARDGVDVFWGPRHLLPFLARGMAKVATVHDFWDRYFPGQEPWLNQCANRTLIAAIIAHADIVVTPSGSTARDAARFHRLAPDRLRVVPWGVDPSVFSATDEAHVKATLARHAIRPPFFLSLDVFNPRKNFALVLEAQARLPEELRSHVMLVGVGKPGGATGAARLHQHAAARGLGNRLRLVGQLAAEDLAALYASAVALIYPSLYEGFGLPVLEAMSAGCPVITSDRSSLPEIAAGAALLVSPRDAAALAAVMGRLIMDSDQRSHLSAAGRRRAASFTWQRTAAGMLAAFAAARARRQPRPATADG